MIVISCWCREYSYPIPSLTWRPESQNQGRYYVEKKIILGERCGERERPMQRSLGSQRPGDMTTLEKGSRNLRLWKQVTYSCLWERPVAHSKPHVLGLEDMLMWSQTLSYKQGIFKKIKIIQMKKVSHCNELVKHLTTVQFMFNIRSRDTVH